MSLLRSCRAARRLALSAPVLLLAACGALQPRLPAAGQTEADAVALLGRTTGRYELPGGGQRLEFARGPAGRHTWMVDLDAGGRVLRAEQVLDPAHFARVQHGMTRDELLRLLGRPGDVQRERGDRQTWSWTFANNDCLWARVTLDARGLVLGGAAVVPDPRCEPNMP